MQRLARWQEGLERLAGDFYAKAAEAFKDDVALSQFLKRLQQDEADHERLMGEVAEGLKGEPESPESDITVSPALTAKLTAPIKKACALLESGRLSKKELLDAVVADEFSEWNDIFSYILNATTPSHRAAQHFAALVQTHKERIERFVEDLPPDLKPERDISALPTFWERKVLIVDDNAPFRDFLEAVFSMEADVSKAENGAEGLALASEHFFDLIVSDVNMPEMDGLEFYRRLVESHPHMGERVLFCSGGVSSEQEEMLRRTGRPCLAKPFDLSVLDRIAANILHQERKST